MNIIRSHAHEVHSEEVNKIALSAEDYKRVVQEDGVHTLAWGHRVLKKKRFKFEKNEQRSISVNHTVSPPKNRLTVSW